MAENRTVLGRWIAYLEDIEAPIVAISRKTPRLLELLVREGVAAPAILDRVITEHSLEARQGTARELVLADDVLIRGSTFMAVHGLVSEAEPHATLHGLPLVVSESARTRLRNTADGPAILARMPLVLDDDATLAFATAEINALGSLGKPLDLDHPIVYARVGGATAQDVDEAVGRFANRAALRWYELSRRAGGHGDGRPRRRSWTVIAPGPASELRKLRVFFDPEGERVAVVPIGPVPATEREIAALASKTPLHGLVRRLPRADGELGLLREQASVAWHEYLVELVDLRPVIDELLSELRTSGLLSGRPWVEVNDVACLLPRQDAVDAADRINDWLAQYEDAIPARSIWRAAEPPSIEPSTRFRWRARAAAERSSSYPEAFSAVLREHKATHEAAAAGEPRLRFDSGLTLGQLSALTSRWGETDAERAHRALDSLIDSGAAIPRYAYTDTDAGRTWLRAFRHGEANADVRAMVLVNALDALAGALGTDKLPEVLAEKYLILLAEHLDVFQRPDLAVSGGIQREWYLYGARPVVDIGGDTVYLQKWAQRRGLFEVVPADDRRDAADTDDDAKGKAPQKPYTRYRITADARRRWGLGLQPDLHHLLAAVARWTAVAYATPDRDPEHALGTSFLNAIASCESALAYESALVAELEGWLEGRPNIDTAWDTLSRHIRSGSATDADGLDHLLQRLANWPAQAKVKRRLFERLDQYLAAADRKWPAQTVGDADTTWRDLVRPAIVARRDVQARDLASVEAAVEFCARMCFLLRCLLAASEPTTPGRTPFDHSVQQGVEGLLEILDATNEVPMSVNRGALRPALERIATVPPREALRDVAAVVAEVRDLVRLVVDPLTPDRVEVLSQSRHFCLVWDVRDSSTRRLDHDIRTKVNESVSRRFGTEIEAFDVHALTDSNQVVSPSLRTVREVMTEVERLYRGHGFSVRFGLDMTSEAVHLYHVPPAQRPTGTLIEHATRLCDLFKEIVRDDTCWTGTRPEEPAGSYVVTSKSFHAFAGQLGQGVPGSRRIAGSFTPRVRDSGPRTVYIAGL